MAQPTSQQQMWQRIPIITGSQLTHEVTAVDIAAATIRFVGRQVAALQTCSQGAPVASIELEVDGLCHCCCCQLLHILAWRLGGAAMHGVPGGGGGAVLVPAYGAPLKAGELNHRTPKLLQRDAHRHAAARVQEVSHISNNQWPSAP